MEAKIDSATGSCDTRKSTIWSIPTISMKYSRVKVEYTDWILPPIE